MTIESVLGGSARWTVINADSRDIVSALPDCSVDVIIGDPPYDEHTQSNIRSVYSSGKERVKRTALSFEHLDDYAFVPELVRVSKRWVLCFCALEQLADYKRAAGESWIRSGIFHKKQAAPQISGDRPANSCEGIAIMHRAGKKHWNGGGKHAFWSASTVRDDRLHPTEKNLALMMELVELFTDPNDVVLDPYCGSGTTLVAALRLGRRAIGIELNERYSEIARERIECDARGISISDERSGQIGLLDRIGGRNV